MASVSIVRTAWAGTSGGAGLTQTAVCDIERDPLNATQAQAAVNAVRAFWDGIKAYVPNEVTWTVSPVVDIYDIIDQELTGSVTAATPPASVTGTATGNYSMAAGLKANLNTGAIAFGRRVRGSIYIVPADSSAFANNGVAAAIARTTINSAGATLLGAMTTGGMDMVVYSRPKTTPTVRSGDVHNITGIETNEKTSVLRGRRD